ARPGSPPRAARRLPARRRSQRPRRPRPPSAILTALADAPSVEAIRSGCWQRRIGPFSRPSVDTNAGRSILTRSRDERESKPPGRPEAIAAVRDAVSPAALLLAERLDRRAAEHLAARGQADQRGEHGDRARDRRERQRLGRERHVEEEPRERPA